MTDGRQRLLNLMNYVQEIYDRTPGGYGFHYANRILLHILTELKMIVRYGEE